MERINKSCRWFHKEQLSSICSIGIRPISPSINLLVHPRLKDIADGNELDEIEVISSKEAAKFPIMASITLFSIYLLYKYVPDKMYYFVTGYFFLLGVAAVTGNFENI